MKICLLVVALGLASVGQVAANLVWENPVADLHPSVSAETAIAHFKYKNTGDKPVTITAVRPSCGCTTAAPPKEAIAPGASGEIVATFHIGDRTGLQTKMIHIATDEPGDKDTILTLHAIVPQVLTVAPTFLFWPKTEALGPKTMEVKVGADFPVSKIDVTSTDPQVETAVKPLPNEKAFQITVTPKVGNRPVNASLRIDPHFPKEKPKISAAYVRVDAHPAETPPSTAAVSPAATAAAPK